MDLNWTVNRSDCSGSVITDVFLAWRFDVLKLVSRFTLLITPLLITGCDSYVPSVEQLQSPNNPSRAFIVEASNFVGINATMDVDTAIYQYKTSTQSSESFWKQIDESSLEHNWELKSENKKWKRFVRIIPKAQQRVYHSFEEVRIAFDSDTQVVTVAWGQADENELHDDMPSNQGEGEWMNSHLWPRFEETIAK